jgi:hypothetical protein
MVVMERAATNEREHDKLLHGGWDRDRGIYPERSMARYLSWESADRGDGMRQINPTGKFLLNPSGKSLVQTRPSHPARGAYRDRHERGLGCGGRGYAFDERRMSGR